MKLEKEAISSKEGVEVLMLFVDGKEIKQKSIASIAHEFNQELNRLAKQLNEVYMESIPLASFSGVFQAKLKEVFNKQVEYDKSYAEVVALLVFDKYLFEVGIDEIIPNAINPNHYPYSGKLLYKIASSVAAEMRRRAMPKYEIGRVLMHPWVVAIVTGIIVVIVGLYIQFHFFQNSNSKGGQNSSSAANGKEQKQINIYEVAFSSSDVNPAVNIDIVNSTKSKHTDWKEISKKAALKTEGI